MRGADGVFHVAAWYKLGAKGTRAAQRINVDGTRNVLQAMQALGIRCTWQVSWLKRCIASKACEVIHLPGAA